MTTRRPEHSKKKRATKKRRRKVAPKVVRKKRRKVAPKAVRKKRSRYELDLDSDWLAPSKPKSTRTTWRPRAPKAAAVRRAVRFSRVKPVRAPTCPFCSEDHEGDGHPFERWDESEARAHRVPRARHPRRDFAVARNHRYRNDPRMTGEE